MNLLDELKDATMYHKEPRELEKLCGNARTEIKWLRESLEAVVAVEEDSPAAYRSARFIAREALGGAGTV